MADPGDTTSVQAARRIAERVLADLKLAGEEARAVRLTQILMQLADVGLDERTPPGPARDAS
ncbi:MAG: hypothetical protein ACREFO_09185 [Acetobacteraceae bacterium]